MSDQIGRRSVKLWTILALAGLGWALIGLAFASIAPPNMVPRVLNNYHLEHFAAFYIVTLLAAAALPSVPFMRISIILCLLSGVFAAFRLLALVNRSFYVEDLACDLGGILAAAAPIIAGRLRAVAQNEF